MALGWSNGTVQIQVVRHSNLTVMIFHTSKRTSNVIIRMLYDECSEIIAFSEDSPFAPCN